MASISYDRLNDEAGFRDYSRFEFLSLSFFVGVFTMLRIRIFAVAVCCCALSIASTSEASLSFSQADLLGMTVSSSNGLSGPASGSLTANPTYGDGQPAMTGIAGATGELNPFIPGGTAFVYYGLTGANLTAFIAAASSGTETLTMVAHNDNNQDWEIGIWYDAGAGIVEASAILAGKIPGPAESSGLSLAIPASVTDAGVFVRNILAGPATDVYHASWSIPEPGTIAVWAGLFGIGAVVAYRRRRIAG